jgi:dihydrofolate reductase
MILSCVVAAAENGIIGAGNQLPWHLPDDLKRFKALTMGKPILMGRKTYESIGRPLPGRTNIIITRRAGFAIEGCTVVTSLADAVAAAGRAEELAVIGGAEVYAQTLPFVSRIHLTRVHAQPAGDVRFPALMPHEWRERIVETHPADERHAYAFSFVELERVGPVPSVR